MPTVWDCELLARETLENSDLFQEEFEKDRSIIAKEAAYLIEGLWGLSSASRLLMRQDNITAEQEKVFQEGLQRRKAGEPLSYITGKKEFYGHDFFVDQTTLIPRADSEALVDMVCGCSDFAPDQKIVFMDWGTGSGCLLISLLHCFAQAMGMGIDKEAKALAQATKNGLAHGMDHRLTWHEMDWNDQQPEMPLMPKGYDAVLIANPPYIRSDDMAGLSLGVRNFEPHLALDGGKNGFCAIEKIFSITADYPKGTHFFMEIGKGQGAQARLIADAHAWHYKDSAPDMQGVERILHFCL